MRSLVRSVAVAMAMVWVGVGTFGGAEDPQAPAEGRARVNGRVSGASSGWVAPAPGYGTNRVEGWTVLVDGRLTNAQPAETARALELLRGQLQEIVRVVPEPALGRLREVILWFSPAYPGFGARAEYHPGAGWLREHGRNPAMVKGVEFTNIPEFERETRRMPNFALHELAHAYHDRVLEGGFGNAEVRAGHERAVASGRYEKVRVRDGKGGEREERAYALTNPMEYFAETTEAFFSRNDVYPFVRAELKGHDPEMAALLERLWGVRENGTPEKL